MTDDLLPLDAGAAEGAVPDVLAPPAFSPVDRSPASRRRVQPRFLPTLFDRLCDDDPGVESEAPQAYASDRSRMWQIVQRDLTLLLNTADQSDLIDFKRHPAAADSTINYGVPPMAGGHVAGKKWVDIETLIRRAILVFEPRLMPHTLVIRSVVQNVKAAPHNVLAFEIAGHIQMQPYPLEFMVQSSVDLETHRIDIQPPRSSDR